MYILYRHLCAGLGYTAGRGQGTGDRGPDRGRRSPSQLTPTILSSLLTMAELELKSIEPEPSPPQPIECSICYDFIRLDSIYFSCPSANSSHSQCSSCFGEYIQHCCDQYAVGKLPVQCPVLNCNKLVDDKTLKLICNQPLNLSKNLWSEYERFSLLSGLLDGSKDNVPLTCQKCNKFTAYLPKNYKERAANLKKLMKDEQKEETKAKITKKISPAEAPQKKQEENKELPAWDYEEKKVALHISRVSVLRQGFLPFEPIKIGTVNVGEAMRLKAERRWARIDRRAQRASDRVKANGIGATRQDLMAQIRETAEESKSNDSHRAEAEEIELRKNSESKNNIKDVIEVTDDADNWSDGSDTDGSDTDAAIIRTQPITGADIPDAPPLYSSNNDIVTSSSAPPAPPLGFTLAPAVYRITEANPAVDPNGNELPAGQAALRPALMRQVSEAVLTSLFFVCEGDGCNAATCLQCNAVFDQSAQESHKCPISHIDEIYNDIIDLLTEGSAQKCPACKSVGQKDERCCHITCEQPGCGVRWCYVCGGQEGKDFDEFSEHNIWSLSTPQVQSRCPMYLNYWLGGGRIHGGMFVENWEKAGVSLERFHMLKQRKLVDEYKKKLTAQELVVFEGMVKEKFSTGMWDKKAAADLDSILAQIAEFTKDPSNYQADPFYLVDNDDTGHNWALGNNRCQGCCYERCCNRTADCYCCCCDKIEDKLMCGMCDTPLRLCSDACFECCNWCLRSCTCHWCDLKRRNPCSCIFTILGNSCYYGLFCCCLTTADNCWPSRRQ
jgi:hypothetical protein